MSDIIQLLPDAVANQIAAGEVIQRPASVVKELIENSIDANANNITVNIKDAGRTLIQVIDNGKGMSETDARMAFERHATSKIRNATDLFSIQSMGFRGEALASIAAVADVELKTKITNNELGTHIHIKGSDLIKQETVSCPEGSNFSVKNLFFNIPARRKFLKKDSTEFKHIIAEFKKVALANPEISFSLFHNEKIIFKLNKVNVKQRIADIFGKSIYKYLIPIDSFTSILKISGFVGKPEIAKKRNEEQYFFVNRRFMKHPYFFRTVMNTYEDILSPEHYPAFFINMEVEPETIDINIHPTKTEIKFEDERIIARILAATVKEAIGKFNITSSMNFDDNQIEIVQGSKDKENIPMPSIHINPDYNPFTNPHPSQKASSTPPSTPSYREERKVSSSEIKGWMDMLKSTQQSTPDPVQNTFFQSEERDESSKQSNVFQVSLKYIVTNTEKGLIVVHQRRAHQRILYERYLREFQGEKVASQQLVFPIEHHLPQNQILLIEELVPELIQIGFTASIEDETITISGLPVNMTEKQAIDTLDDMIERFEQVNTNIDFERQKFVAKSVAQKASVGYISLSHSEMQDIISDLFKTSEPSYSPTGKRIFSIISLADIDQMLRI